MVQVIKGSMIGAIPNGALSIVRVEYQCEQCGKMHEKAFVLHHEYELGHGLYEMPDSLEGVLVNSVDEAVGKMGGDADVAMEDVMGEFSGSGKLSKLEQRGAKMFATHMEATEKKMVRLMRELQKLIDRDDYSFLPKKKCEECGHVQSWMGRKAGVMSMLAYMIVLGVLGYRFYRQGLDWGALSTMQYVMVGVMALFVVLLVRDAIKLAFGGNQAKSHPRVWFDAVQFKVYG